MKKIITAVIFTLPLILFISIASAVQVEQKYPCIPKQRDQNLVDAKSRVEADFAETQEKLLDTTQQHQKAIQSRDEELKNLYNDCNDRLKKNSNNFLTSQEIKKDYLRNQKDIQKKYNKTIFTTWNEINKLQKRADYLQFELLKLEVKKQREEKKDKEKIVKRLSRERLSRNEKLLILEKMQKPC